MTYLLDTCSVYYLLDKNELQFIHLIEIEIRLRCDR